MSFYKGLFDALEARNRAQTSPDDMWISTPWCSVGSDTYSAGHYYALPRLDLGLSARCSAQTKAKRMEPTSSAGWAMADGSSSCREPRGRVW